MTVTASKPRRSALRWHGGKWRLAPWPACAAALDAKAIPLFGASP